MIHCVKWHDLEFERVPVKFRSERGVPQTRWVKTGMPYIPQEVVNSVFYLYASREDALAGTDAGGTGFVVKFDSNVFDEEHVLGNYYYGITNWHVACDFGFSVIRLNTKDGGTDIIELGPEDWQFMPGKYDVAIVPLVLDDAIHQVSSISTNEFALEPPPPDAYTFGSYQIGVGDDVFMIGLFVDHDGVTTNVPSARFGHVSMLPNPKATIEQPTGYRGESYVVDMHSRTGFSGSPVFVYRTFGSDLTQGFFGHAFDEIELDDFGMGNDWGTGSRTRYRGRLRVNNFFRLLGIHWGQFPEEWELRDKPGLAEARKRGLVVEGGYVKGMSGMTCVIPSWHITEVLNMPRLKDLRRTGKAELSPLFKPEAEAVASRATKPESDENPEHLEDFTRLVSAASKRKPTDGQT